MIPTHAFTMNGRRSWDVQDGVRPVHDEIRHMLGRLNAHERYSLGLWKLPDGVPLDLVDLDEDRGYIQSAGSADRMTVEVRTIENGSARQVVIGRPLGAASSSAGDPEEVIPWDECEARVYPNEVFDEKETAELFISYYDTGDVPSGYLKRAIQL